MKTKKDKTFYIKFAKLQKNYLTKNSLTFEKVFTYNKSKMLAGEGSSLAPLPFPFSNLGASPASATLDKILPSSVSLG